MANPRIIETNENSDLYGLGFSNAGTEMYITNADGMIGFQLDSLGTENEIAEIEATKSNVAGTGYGAVQRGPDGQVYFAIDNSQNLGIVASDQDGNVQVNEIAPPALDPDGVGRISRIGLPNFTQSVGVLASEPGYAVENACLGQDVRFEASGTSIIDEYYWDFGDNASPPVSSAIGSADSVAVRYDTTGIFAFELQIINRCARERDYPGDPVNPSRLPPLPPPFSLDTTFFDEVEVFRTPGLPTIPDDTSLCNGPILLEAWPVDSAGLLYYWSTGDTTRTINVLEPDPRIIQTAISTLEGCTSDTLEVFIGDGRPQIDLGPDQAYCQFETIPDLDAQNVQVFYDWRIDEEPANDTRFQPVNSDSVGTFIYSILVREPRNNCEGSDTVAITIRESPDISSTFTPPSTCGAGDASFEFTIENSGSFLYSLLNPDTTVNAAVDGPVTPPAIDSLSIGAYNFFVENIVTGCRYTEPLFVEDDVPFDLFASNLPDRDTEASIQIGLSGTALPERTNVYVTNLSQDTVFTQRNLVPPLTISPVLDSGLYFVNVEDVSNGCFQVDSVLVRQLVANPEDCRPFIIAPNAFSPNGNSQNEEFYIIPNPYIDQFEIYIYTRWGELVYYSDQKNFRWDGKYQNKYLPVGTYAYVIRYTSLESEFAGEQVQYGSVTLVR
jgi:gliding motility-associated-like protein